FLIGRLLLDTLTNLRLVEPAKRALESMGVDFDRIRTSEPDAALGNGGLGRLAACFMDSMSALGVPAYGYGIRYENGLFEQRLADGWQQELPEDWLARGNPWEFKRTEPHYSIGFGGAVEYLGGDDKTARAVWYPAERVEAIPYDTPIAGWRGRHVNALRLWSARAAAPIQLATLATLPDHAAIQLNDTHPAIAVAELMRILVDDHDYSWDRAWTLTKATL